jgi:hypothetical protein
MKTHILVFTNRLKENNSCAFTTKVPILKRNYVIRNTPVTYSPTALLFIIIIIIIIKDQHDRAAKVGR